MAGLIFAVLVAVEAVAVYIYPSPITVGCLVLVTCLFLKNLFQGRLRGDA